MAVRFYAAQAPRWWPYQMVSLANRRLPPVQRPGFYRVLVDNGMFSFMNRPDLEHWLRRLWVFVQDIERLRRPSETWVVLPDWLHDVEFVLQAVQHPLAKRICKDYTCVAVAHSNIRFLAAEGGPYGYVASILASIDHIAAIGAPLKLTCLKYDPKGRRRVVDKRGLQCQLNIVEQVCSTAKRYGLSCHGLGLVLDPIHVKRAVELGLSSFDSTAWTRPNKTVVKKLLGMERLEKGIVSAKNTSEKDLFLRLKIYQLLEAGVNLEQVDGFFIAAP